LPEITVTSKSLRNNPLGALDALRRSDVLVGITQESSSRPGEPINNAELMFIHTNGSPIRHIPARPVIEPAIMADGNRQPIAEELKEAAAAFLQKEPEQVLRHMNRAGMIGQNAAKSWFNDSRNNWPPEKRATVLRKLRKARGKTRKAALEAIEGMDEIGNVPGVNTMLIDTGALRQAIKYVVRFEK
jgi:hypothetical protein